MAKGKARKKGGVSTHNVWECAVCCAQMMGGPRCELGNPTPAQREADPQRYAKMQFAPNRRDSRTAAAAQINTPQRGGG